MLGTISKAVKEFGGLDTWKQMRQCKEVKAGTLVGTDKNGNRYYENRAEQYGRDRWVVYNTGADLMDYDPATIPSEWHGWLHHMHDKLPEKLEKPFFATDPSFDPVMKTGRDTKYQNKNPIFRNQFGGHQRTDGAETTPRRGRPGKVETKKV